MCTFSCCGTFCMGLSIFCGIALLVTGIFLSMESPSIHIPMPADNHTPAALSQAYKDAAANCFIGLGIYGGVFILSLACICFDRYKKRSAPLAQPLLSANSNMSGYQQQSNQYH